MKNLLLLFLFVIFAVSATFAQDPINPAVRRGLIANFSETDLTWVVFDCANEATLEIVDNPVVERGGMAAKVTTTACTWEGIALTNEFLPFDFSIRNLFTVDVYSPAAGRTVMFKVEDFNDSGINVEVQATTTVANEWETLVFDFTGAEAGKYSKIAVFPDFGAENAGEDWYFDNVNKKRDLLTYDDGILVDFEDNFNYMFFWSCGDIPADMLIIENPLKTEANPSDTVLMYITSSCTWDGFATGEKFVPFNFDERWVFKLKVWSPAPGLTVKFKIEQFENNQNSLSIDAVTTTADDWEELTFDFYSLDDIPESDFYGRIAIFPDFGSEIGEDEWFIDDIMFINPETSIEDEAPVTDYELAVANYPNPFNPATTISYELPEASDVILNVYDVSGKLVQTLVSEHKFAGAHSVQFDATELPSGVYEYRLTAADLVVSKKMLLVK